MSESHDREVRYETAEKIAKIPANFTGNVQIPELRIVCPRNQIVKVEIRNKTIQELMELGKLPTQSVQLTIETDENGRHRKFTKPPEGVQAFDYINAEVHYRERNGERLYFTKPEQIKKAVFVHASLYFAPNTYDHAVYKTERYGETTNGGKSGRDWVHKTIQTKVHESEPARMANNRQSDDWSRGEKLHNRENLAERTRRNFHKDLAQHSRSRAEN